MAEGEKRLRTWLDDHKAHFLWSVDGPEENEHIKSIECWRLGSTTIMIKHWRDGHGFDIYTHCPSNSISESFKDAEERCGVK